MLKTKQRLAQEHNWNNFRIKGAICQLRNVCRQLDLIGSFDTLNLMEHELLNANRKHFNEEKSKTPAQTPQT